MGPTADSCYCGYKRDRLCKYSFMYNEQTFAPYEKMKARETVSTKNRNSGPNRSKQIEKAVQLCNCFGVDCSKNEALLN